MSEQTKKSAFNKLNIAGSKVYALVYCRVSSDKQEKEGHGLDSQEKRCRDYAASKSYVVEEGDVFRDTASGGGAYTTRPGQVGLISRIDKYPHRNYVVLVDDISRLARDVSAHFALRKELRDREVEIESPNFNFENTPEGELIEGVMASVSQHQRKHNARQVIQKQKARLEAGYWAFVAKKGYTMAKDPLHGKLSVPNEDSEAIKTALESFANGTFVRKIDACKYLVEKGIWKGKRPEKYIDQFTAMLKDSFYPGWIEYAEWEVARRPGFHKPLISNDTYELNQKRLSGKGLTNRIRLDITPDFPLRGLIACDHCDGGHITGYWSKKHKYQYYGCQNKLCPRYMKTIRKENVEKQFIKLLKQNRLKDEVGKLVAAVFDEVWDEEVNNLKKQQEAIQRETRALREKADGITAMALNAKSEQARRLYEAQVEKIASDIEMVSSEYSQELDLSVPYRTALEKSVGLLKNPYAVWHSLEAIEQHRLFFFIFEAKLPYHQTEGYRTDKAPCSMRLFEQFATQNTDDVDLRRIELLPLPCHGSVIPFYYRPS
jgi:site-specific DNA recombinase